MRLLPDRVKAAVTAGAVAAASAAVILGTTQPAAATGNLCTNVNGYFWSTEQDMADAQTLNCRRTWTVDPGIGAKLSRQQLVQQHAGFYEGRGISRQFLWYAPQGNTHIPAGSPQKFSACDDDPIRNGNECLPGNVITNPGHTISFDFGGRGVDLETLSWAGNFVALVCGNFSVPLTNAAPVPTIRGMKFDDGNRNGIQDAGEGGVGGIGFRLVRHSSLFGDQDPGAVTSTISAADGSFAFALNNIGPGAYTVEEVPQAGWVPTTTQVVPVTVPEGIGNAEIGVAFGNRAQHPPVADAGPDQTIDQRSPDGAPVTLDGWGSFDPDGDELTYTWTGPFGTATGVAPTVTLPVGTWTVTLTVNDGIDSDTDTTTVTVYPPITAAGADVSSLEGQQFEGTVATFTDPDPSGTPAQYAATIDWGDGNPATAGRITKGSDGVFTVTDRHTYLEEGSFPITVSIADPSNAFNADEATSTSTVGDAPLYATGADVMSTNPFSGTVATFTDTNPYAPLADFTASIDWGDGTAPTAGTITGPTGGPFSVAGSHQYATLGPKTITVRILDEGGSTATATTKLLLYALSGGGNFVIGDQNASVGTDVTYWGAQWWRENGLTGGPAPAAFKGYANSPTDVLPTSDWTTDPGNSAGPPTAVPSYMAVIVSSSIGKSGSTISGDVPHVVIVKTGPGYAANPGHAGMGTVVAVLR